LKASARGGNGSDEGTDMGTVQGFKGRHFDQEITVLVHEMVSHFKLSSRDLVQMMAERGIGLAQTTILRWV
jgi:transposase-like protein